MTMSNKTMERIMRQDSNLSPYDGFRIGGIGKVLNQIGLNQRKHHIIYKKEILEELSRLKEEIAVTMKWIHIGTIEVQPVVGRYEGMLEIAGHEFLVAGVAGRENGCMTLGLSFLEDHKPWGRKEYFAAYIDSGSGICTAKPGVFPKEARETLPVLRREKAFNRIMPIHFRSKRGDFDAKLTNPKMQDKRKFGKNSCLSGNRDSSIVIVSTRNLRKKSRTSGKPCSPGFLVRNHGEIKRGILIDEAGIELQEHIVEKIRNFPDVLKDKKQLQSFLGVVNFAGIFIKDLAKYRKDFWPLLKETESAKWKWEEIHTKRVRELKQVFNNLPKLAIPQDEDELVVYTDANDYRWAAVLMKKTTTGKNLVDTQEGCSLNNKPKCGTLTRKNSLQFGRRLRNGLCFTAKEFTLKVDNTNVKAFLKK
ncbi:hypothetical protein Sango_3106600 [Sesamum angolense]|uniref:Reverse transcriptase/retrotransposon-derived protein RNase H-like domain-containing protein n=1 Tax=Sesamum angolense TaxID=2727404 RepID=A0AAE1W143_9LAMI|nr:hypothetical protein Sango_3106600 [Sesamum angolense]